MALHLWADQSRSPMNSSLAQHKPYASPTWARRSTTMPYVSSLL